VLKTVVFFVDVRPNQRHTANVARHGESKLAWLQVVSMAANRILILGALGHALWALIRRRRRLPLALLLFTGAYAAPYLVGFAYYRHVVPLVPLAAVYLVSVWREREGDEEVLPVVGGQGAGPA